MAAGSSSDDLWCLGGHGRLRLCVDGVVLGCRSQNRHVYGGNARPRVKNALFYQNSDLQQSQKRAVFAPGPRPFGSGMPLGCSGGKSQLKGEIFFFVPRGDRLVAQRTPQGGDFFFAPLSCDLPFKHLDITPEPYWLNLGTPTGRFWFWFRPCRVLRWPCMWRVL